jgi:two-component system NarL family response regulator
MDIRMPVCDGLTATRLIKAQLPEMKIIILTTSADDEDLFTAIKCGACGYLLKSTRGADFIEALRGIEKGIPPFSPGLADWLLGEFSRLSSGENEKLKSRDQKTLQKETGEIGFLTRRQKEVLQLVASGLTYKEVGVQLSLSETTVRYHMGEIIRLLHLENRSQVIAYAGKLGITGSISEE